MEIMLDVHTGELIRAFCTRAFLKGVIITFLFVEK
jgi:hypothetical protein